MQASHNALYEKIAAKICHDLATPLSALGMGVEMLQGVSSANIQQEAIDLLYKSIKQAQTKLSFLRALFAPPHPASFSSVWSVVRESFTMHNIDAAGVDIILQTPWANAENWPILITHALFLIDESMPRGGKLQTQIQPHTQSIAFHISAPIITFHEETLRALHSTSPAPQDMTARTVVAHLLATNARSAQVRCTWTASSPNTAILDLKR